MAPRATAVNGSGAIGIQIYGYAGGFDDPTSGLVHFGQRWYDPATGRWTQPDALETLADPTGANRYEYANGNPINYVDPTGRIPGSCVQALYGAGLFITGVILSPASAGATFALSAAGAGSAAVAVGDGCTSPTPREPQNPCEVNPSTGAYACFPIDSQGRPVG